MDTSTSTAATAAKWVRARPRLPPPPRELLAWQVRLRDPCLTALLGLQLVAIFVLMPMAATGVPIPPVVTDSLIVLVIAVVLVASSSRVAIAIAILSILLTALSAALRLMRPSMLNEWIGHIGDIVGLITLTAVIGRTVFADGRVTFHRIQGAVAIYLNVALIFASAYRLIVVMQPGAFSGLSAIHSPGDADHPGLLAAMTYFSITALTSTGFGDIVPLHPIARSVVNLESIIGQLYPATILARVVTLELEFRRQRRPRHEPPD